MFIALIILLQSKQTNISQRFIFLFTSIIYVSKPYSNVTLSTTDACILSIFKFAFYFWQFYIDLNLIHK